MFQNATVPEKSNLTFAIKSCWVISHVKFQVQTTLEGLSGSAAVCHFECHPEDKVCGVRA
jgi:hypothetical protein